MKRSTRYLSMLLVLVMMLGVIPAISFASSAESIKLTIESATRGDNGAATTTPIDGSPSGYVDISWDLGGGTQNPQCYVELTLAEECSIDAINVVNYQGNRYYHWQVYVTNDNTKDISQWTAVGGKTTDEKSTVDGYTHTLDTPVVGKYVRVYGTYHNSNGGYHFNEVTIYGEPTALNRDRISIKPYGTGFENWISNSASNGAATQLLLQIGDSTIYDANDNPVTVNGKTIVDGLKNGTLKTQLVISGAASVTLDMNPSSIYDTWLLRFETCLAATPFIPENGGKYDITLNVLSTADKSLVYTGTTSATCNVDPIIAYDDVEPTSSSLTFYYEGNEVNGNPKTLIILPNGVPKHYFVEDFGYEFEMVVNGTAVYRDFDMYAHYNWGASYMAGARVLECGWFPAPNVGYDIAINIYAPAYPSGNMVLVHTYNMATQMLLEKEEVLPTLLYNYEFTAENGKVLVDVEGVASTETVECPKGSDIVNVSVPFVNYCLTAQPDVPGAEFLGWYVDGEKIAETSTVYKFTAVKGADVDVVAKFAEVANSESVNDIKFEGYQVSTTGHDIRFIASVDNTAYKSVDLLINVVGHSGKNFSYPTANVYKTLNGIVDGELVPVVTTKGTEASEAGVYTVDAEYLYGLAVSGIPTGTYEFTITPVATTEDGKTCYGKTVTVSISLKDPELTEMDGVTFTEVNGRYENQEYKYNDGYTSIPAGESEFGYYAQLVLKAGEESSITIDLTKKCDLSKVAIYMYSASYSFELYGSNDNSDWTHLGSSSSVSFTNGAFTLDVAGQYRYVKVKAVSGMYDFFTVFEIDVFGSVVK